MTTTGEIEDSTKDCGQHGGHQNVITVFQNQTTIVFQCMDYHILQSGDLMRMCVNGTWTGSVPNCFIDSVMPKHYLVLLIVGITILVFGFWIPLDFYRFRRRKKECREKQMRVAMIKRIGPMHVKMIADLPTDVENGGNRATGGRKFGFGSILTFFKLVRKRRQRKQRVLENNSINEVAEEPEAVKRTESSSNPSTSTTQIIQEVHPDNGYTYTSRSVSVEDARRTPKVLQKRRSDITLPVCVENTTSDVTEATIRRMSLNMDRTEIDDCDYENVTKTISGKRCELVRQNLPFDRLDRNRRKTECLTHLPAIGHKPSSPTDRTSYSCRKILPPLDTSPPASDVMTDQSPKVKSDH